MDDVVELAPLIDRIIKDGLSVTVFVGLAVFLLKKFYKRPNQLQRIERKIDILAERQGIRWDAHGLTDCGTVSATKSKWPFISRFLGSITVRGAVKFIKYLIGGIHMKDYLKKLGRTKFQALLASLVVNIVSAILFMTGTLDIDGVINQWMPVINMTVATISTWVYIVVEGGIDKANVQGDKKDDSDLTIPTDTRV